jgi:hypothetical protein
MIFPEMGFQPIFSQHETAIRIGCFLVIFTVIAVVEIVAPRRPLTVKRSLRWFGNLSVHLLNGAVSRLAFPLLPVGMAVLWAQKGWGLLNIAPSRKGMDIGLTCFRDIRYARFRKMIMIPLENR